MKATRFIRNFTKPNYEIITQSYPDEKNFFYQTFYRLIVSFNVSRYNMQLIPKGIYYKYRPRVILFCQYIAYPKIVIILKYALRFLSLYYLLSSIISILKSYHIITRDKNKRFVHFDYHHFLVTPFYWTRYLNLKRYGKNGNSSYMGTENHDLSQYWFYTEVSLQLNYKLGVIFYILSGIILAVSFVPFLNSYYSILFFFLLLLNSKCYHYFVFVSQNYNALAWSISPVYLYLSFSDQYLAASLVLLLISFLGFTTTVCLIFISFGIAFDNNDYIFVLVPIISIFKLSTHIFITNGLNGIADKVSKIAKAIGFTKRNTKYIYKNNDFPVSKLLILCIFYANLFLNFGIFSYTLLFALSIYYINFKLSRFTDNQSIDILLFILMSSLILHYQIFDIISIILYIISSNYLLFSCENNTFIKKPINCLPIINKLNTFSKIFPRIVKYIFLFLILKMFTTIVLINNGFY